MVAGTSTSFSVTATPVGEGTLSYQWEYSSNGTDFVHVDAGTGGTTNTFTVTALIGYNGYKVRCVVTNTIGTETASTTSNAVTLTVTAS